MRGAVILAVVMTLCAPAVHAASGGHLEGYIHAVAHADGRFGSSWTSDVWIYQQGASLIHLWFNATGSDNTDNESVVVSLDQPVTHLSDIVAGLFGTEGVGSVHYLADGPVTVVSRTWTSTEGGVGTYGQTIPGMPISMASTPGMGQGGALRTLVDQRAGFRANLGLVNVSGNALTVIVEIFTADGEPAPGDSSFTVDLEPFEMRQVNDVLDRLENGERQGLIIRAGIDSGNGGILAYLSEVDNRTNDASYQDGFRFAF